MNSFDIKKQILPIYLLIMTLLQVEPTYQNIFLASLPLIIVSISIHIQKKKIGILGIFLYLLTLTALIKLPNMSDFRIVFLELFFLVLPSIFLLSLILQLENKQMFYLPEKKKPLVIAASLLTIIIFVFYLSSTILWGGFLLYSESTEGQILFLAAITIISTLPFLFAKNYI